MDKSAIINRLFLVVALLEKEGDSIFSAAGLTTRLAAVLLCIQNGASKNSDLCQFLEGTPSAIAQKISTLEKRGLIIRKQGKIDRREYHFSLTTAGKTALKTCAPRYSLAIEKLFEPFSDTEIRKFSVVLKTLEKRILFSKKHHILSSLLS